VLPQLDLRRLTPNTVGSLQELEAELYRVRKNGYACDLEEHELHIRCIAAPIWDHTGSVHASLSITAPAVRMAVSRLRQLAPLIQEAGLRISHQLGYQTSGRTSHRSLSRKTGIGEATSLAKATL
jgi:DNA-binding IclR family transcriptional regulator